MMQESFEFDVLKFLAKNHLARKSEIIKNFSGQADKGMVDSVIGSLMDKNYVNSVALIGEGCFVITQAGAKAVMSGNI